MIKVRKARDRGHADHGWLNTYHTFSFAGYQDPNHMGFRSLRVMNEDRVQPGEGFGPHGHRDMEIISYVLEGALEHKDSMGNGSVLRPGMFQRMTAGRGVQPSEFNASKSEPMHFYQIWILPESQGLKPGYEERNFTLEEKRDRLRLVASRDGNDNSLLIHQDVSIYLSVLHAGKKLGYPINPDRHVWLQLVRGKLKVNDHELDTSDGVAISEESELNISGLQSSEFMLFYLE